MEWDSLRAGHGREGRRTLHEALVQDIGRMIQDGELSPGEHLSEARLCERFEVSRTPLREALKVLASDGYVVWRANHGARVASVDPQEMASTFEVLAGLERMIGETACARVTAAGLRTLEGMHAELAGLHARHDRAGYFRLNQAVHAALAQGVGNAVLADVYCGLQRRVHRARAMSNGIRLRWDASMAEHERIMAALRRRDAELLTHELVAHSRATQAVTMAQLHLPEPAAPDCPGARQLMASLSK